MSQERFNKILAVLIAVVTVFAAIIAQLQTVAGDNDDRAGRDAKAASVEAFGVQVRGDATSNYNYYQAFEQYRELETLRETAEQNGQNQLAERYSEMRDGLLDSSPLLGDKDPEGKPYFDPEKDAEPDVARFEANTYVEEVARDLQVFKAASVVKNIWDEKANTYIVHLTLLAVSLFLFGLAGTIATRATRGIFTTAGLIITGIAVIWAVQTWSRPVYDLRKEKQAIQHFARGYALSHQGREDEAVKEYDLAIADAPPYADAYLEKGRSLLALEKPDLAKALESFQKARELEPGDPSAPLEIAWVQYQLGQFDPAIKSAQESLANKPQDVESQFLIGLCLAAQGQGDEAGKAYDQGLQWAADNVAELSKAAGEVRAPGELISTIEEASVELDNLAAVVNKTSQVPPPDKVQGGDATAKLANNLGSKLVSWELALMNTGKPPAEGELAAKLGELEFTALDPQGNEIEPEGDDVFRGEVAQMNLSYDFSGMKNGQVVTTRYFLESDELDSWRWTEPWKEGQKGRLEDEPCYPGYSANFRFEPGHYVVEVFVDNKLAMDGEFEIKE